ncbi:phage protein [Alicyclobacillus macrosporangiidus]|nr:phage protein [Alicyclobacillus macrosporangiidus]
MTTYSFADVSAVVSHPSLGQYVANGAGLGSIRVTMATENTKHDVAADGSVMVTKTIGKNGTIAFEIQQTSGFDQWLRNSYNYLYTADTSQWAQMSIVIRSPIMGDLITATGCAFKIRPERPYEADGQKVTWEIMAANIDEFVA